MRRTQIAHTFLLAAFPILFLYQFNIAEVSFSQVSPFLFATLFVALALFIIMRFLLKDSVKASLAVSVLLVQFFSFGHIAEATKNLKPAGLDNELVLSIIWFIVAVAALTFLAKTKWTLCDVSRILNAIAVTLILVSLFNIGSDAYGTKDFASLSGPTRDIAAINRLPADTKKPDIYYIILDSYPSEANIKSVYNYDNSSFYDYLEKRGFYVAAQSHSNYTQTYLSLASSLNMEYINFLSKRLGTQTENKKVPLEMLKNNKVAQLLKKNGYTFVHVRSSWSATDYNKYADLQINSGYGSEFTVIMLQTTGLRLAETWFGVIKDSARSKTLSIFSNVPKIAKLREPTFTFAHIVPPHPPYFFGENGEKVKKSNFELKGKVWSERDKYIGQLKFVNKKVKVMIDDIIANSASPPIIIVQGDHGPASLIYTDENHGWNNPTQKQLKERTKILSAYYLPGKRDVGLYPSITPVNSFRLIFNSYFKTNFKTLPDKTYYSTYQSPYLLKEVTNLVR